VPSPCSISSEKQPQPAVLVCNAMPQRFDANLVEFFCPRCRSDIREPMGSFRRPYQCYGCGVEIRIPMLAELERQAELFGARPYRIIVRQVRTETANSCKWGPAYGDPIVWDFDVVEVIEKS
jgi:hypothetical protein